MNFYNIEEKTQICLDIAKKLKNFENDKGCVNLFDGTYSFVPKLKKIFSEYIKGTRDYSGTLDFEEIHKKIVYHFPISKKKKATFVIKVVE
jgi:hypothetical protein